METQKDITLFIDNTEKLILEFTSDEISYKNKKLEDIADAYKIYKHSECSSGLFVAAKYANHQDWLINPWNVRAVIQYLLKQSGLWDQRIVETNEL